jgi:hypothetical protein
LRYGHTKSPSHCDEVNNQSQPYAHWFYSAILKSENRTILVEVPSLKAVNREIGINCTEKHEADPNNAGKYGTMEQRAAQPLIFPIQPISLG